MLLKDKNIPFRKIVYLQTWLFCKMYLNTVYEIRDQKLVRQPNTYCVTGE